MLRQYLRRPHAAFSLKLFPVYCQRQELAA
jgi:hypothetical protein